MNDVMMEQMERLLRRGDTLILQAENSGATLRRAPERKGERLALWACGKINGKAIGWKIKGIEMGTFLRLRWVPGENIFDFCYEGMEEEQEYAAYGPGIEEGDLALAVYYQTEETVGLWVFNSEVRDYGHLFLTAGREGRERPRAELVLEIFGIIYRAMQEADSKEKGGDEI